MIDQFARALIVSHKTREQEFQALALKRTDSFEFLHDPISVLARK